MRQVSLVVRCSRRSRDGFGNKRTGFMNKNLKPPTIEIRPLTLADAPFLWEMLYQALYVPHGHPPFPREIVQEPEISRYVHDWGKPDDLGFMALEDSKPVGAVWLRLLTGDNRAGLPFLEAVVEWFAFAQSLGKWGDDSFLCALDGRFAGAAAQATVRCGL